MFAPASPLAQSIIGHTLAPLDWAVVVVFLAVTTIVAVVAKGHHTGIRSFFLADRTLPWGAVCLALMATEVSAASYSGVPGFAYGGSLVYLQLAIGTILARVIIGYYFVPAFYEDELYSPYHFLGRRLGMGAESMTSGLFLLGALIGQGVRLFILAGAIYYITGLPITSMIIVIVLFAAIWAAIGGLRTVVWTGVVQFGVLLLGCVVAAVYLIGHTSGGLTGILSQASSNGKLQVFDFTAEQALEFTIWTGLFGSTFNTLASNGADQMNAQMLFSCRSAGDARKTIITSSLNQLLVLLMLFIGLGLFAYYQGRPADLQGATESATMNRVFAYFIGTALPAGVKGILVAGLLAAGISSLSPALTALAQVTVRWFSVEVHPNFMNAPASQIGYSRFFTLAWGVVMALAAIAFEQMTEGDDLVNMALRLTSFTYGALIGSLLLALVARKRDGRGILFGAPFAVLTTLGMIWHDAWAHWTLIVGVGVMIIWWFYTLHQEVEYLASVNDHNTYVRRAWYILLGEFPRTLWVLVASAIALSTHWNEFTGEALLGGQFDVAWPWYLPMGVGITIVFGYMLSRPAAAEPLTPKHA